MRYPVTSNPLKPRQYKSDVEPIWCPGCGHFAVLSALTRAWSTMKLDAEQAVMISGIGCSSRLPAYAISYGFHGVHGRALPVAIGIKLARPDLCVVGIGGDGDGYSIGGNHFIHGCRRNVDMTYIVMDNEVYGMTKGQASPTSPEDWHSKLQPGGTWVPPFRPISIALASGANFVARGFSGDPNGLAKIIIEGINHPGFSFIEVLSPCITYRPDQRGWKGKVHPTSLHTVEDAVTALQMMANDDGMTTGIFYKGHRTAFGCKPDGSPIFLKPTKDISEIEAELRP